MTRPSPSSSSTGAGPRPGGTATRSTRPARRPPRRAHRRRPRARPWSGEGVPGDLDHRSNRLARACRRRRPEARRAPDRARTGARVAGRRGRSPRRRGPAGAGPVSRAPLPALRLRRRDATAGGSRSAAVDAGGRARAGPWRAGRWRWSAGPGRRQVGEQGASLRSGRARRTRRRAAGRARRRCVGDHGWAASRRARASDRCSPWEAWVRAGRPPTVEVHVVAVGPDGGHAPPQVVGAAAPAPRRGPRPSLGARSARRPGRASGDGDGVVGLGEHRREPLEERPAPGQSSPRRRQLGVPHVEGERRALVEPAAGALAAGRCAA